MELGKTLAVSAVMGILAASAACGGGQTDARTPAATDPASSGAGEKNGCGNHPDGGSCGAHDPQKK